MPPLDKPARALQCPQCSAWVLLGQVNGFKVAVDAAALDVEAYRAALLAGRDVYALGGTGRLRGPMRARGWTPPMRQRKAEHPCRAFASVPLDAPKKAPGRRTELCVWQGGHSETSTCLRTPQQAAQGVRSCQACDPAPFDLDRLAPDKPDALFVQELGATVVSIEIDGKVVYQDASLA